MVRLYICLGVCVCVCVMSKKLDTLSVISAEKVVTKLPNDVSVIHNGLYHSQLGIC